MPTALSRSVLLVVTLALTGCHRAPTPTTPTPTPAPSTAAREEPLTTRDEPVEAPPSVTTEPAPATAGLRGLDLVDERTSVAAFADLDAVRRSELDGWLARAIREYADGDPIKTLIARKLYEAHAVWCYATVTSDGLDVLFAIEGIDVAAITPFVEANEGVRFVGKHGDAREYALSEFSFALRAPDTLLIGAHRVAEHRIAPMRGFGAWADRFGGVASGRANESLRGTVHAVGGEQANAFVALLVTPEVLALGGEDTRARLSDPFVGALVSQIRSLAVSANLGARIHFHGLMRGSSPDLAAMFAAFASPAALREAATPKQRVLVERLHTRAEGNDFHAELDATIAELREIVEGRGANEPAPPTRRGVR